MVASQGGPDRLGRAIPRRRKLAQDEGEEPSDEAAAPPPFEARVELEAAGERLDKWLVGRMPDLSRSRLQALVRAGAARVGDAPASGPSQALRAGDLVRLLIPPPEAALPEPEAIPLSVVHEDAHLIVIDKPAGLVVHPAGGHPGGTLVNALLHHCGSSLSGVGGVLRPGIVHRLDKDTSGLLVVAKSDAAHRGLSAQFADHGRTGPLERVYTALAWNVPALGRTTIDLPLERSPRDRERMAVAPSGRGRMAITHFGVEETFGEGGRNGAALVSLLSCALETGRTHQIRVHLAHAGHPLLGDQLYGAGFKTKAARLGEAARVALEALGRQALHAGLLGFEHPVTGETLHFQSPLPPDIAALLDALRHGSQTVDS